MNAVIYRGTQEIGGTLIELENGKSRLLLDAGYPLFLNGNPIDDKVAKQPPNELLKLGVLPAIQGLYKWDLPSIDGIIISVPFPIYRTIKDKRMHSDFYVILQVRLRQTPDGTLKD